MASAAKVQHSKFDAQSFNPGLNVVYPNDEQASLKLSTKVEIIAIPGLGADPEYTWKKDKVHWLRDANMLPKKIPHAKISVFQYQSQWFGKGSVDERIDNVANKLLHGLDRSRVNETKTPIIFIAHCLGGIILEKALLMARSRQRDFPNVYPWVAGCFFLGTPFHGTSSQSKALVLASMAELVGWGTPTTLLKVLEKDSEILRSLLTEFSFMARDAQIRLLCFWEENDSDLVNYMVKGVSWLKSKERIVDQASATIESFESLSLMSDHFQLNKFSGPKDGNFTTVSDEIRELASKADSIIKTRQNMLRQSQVDDRTYHSMIDALSKGFVDIEAAMKGSYREAKGAKLSSILELESFQQWRTSDTDHVFWIHGKAGTGQGAIASSALECLKKGGNRNSMVASFFCDQSDRMRRTLKGLLQTIVRQLLDSDQDLARHLLLDSQGSRDGGSQIFNAEETLKIPALWTALQKMSQDIRESTVYVVVHGVEQLAQDSLEQFLTYMQGTIETATDSQSDGGSQPIKWLLLNRSGRPIIEKYLKDKVPEIDLNDAGNSAQVSDDLKAHISVSVDELGLPASLAYFVKRHIYLRAEENWIYVSLVIRELKNAWKPGRTQHADIRKLLESFPYGLTDMFEHIRKRVLSPQAEGYEYTKEILRCRILSYIAPTMRELAVMAGLPHEDLEDLEKLEAYIIRCGAFLTLRGNDWDLDNSTVEWIDISAAEHLTVYSKYELSLDLDEMQHGIIALRSLEYIYQAIEDQDTPTHDDEQEEWEAGVGAENAPDEVDFNAGGPVQYSQVNDNPEIDEADSDDMTDTSTTQEDDEDEGLLDVDLRYPVRYWVEHAKRAPPDVLEEFNFSHSFWQKDSEARQRWWNTIQEVHSMVGQRNISSLHVAVILEFPALVDHLINLHGTLNVHEQDSLGFQPLYYACESGNEETIKILLGAGADIDFKSCDGNPTALHAACSNGRYDVVKILLDRNANVNASSIDHGTALYAAVGSLDNRIVELLLDRHAEVNIIGGTHRRALNLAAFTGNIDAVRILIEHGADIDPDEDYWYGSALGAAVRRGHADVVHYLLLQSWSLYRPIKTYGSFLSAAATYNHHDVLEILLQGEDRVLVLEQALQAAAQRGYASIVEAILKRDSELPSSTLRHQRSFSLAAFYGRTDVLQLLYPCGIDQAQLDEALYQATDNKHLETVKCLLDFGADPNVEGPIYGFALAASAYDGTKEIMRALLDRGADVNKRGGDYGTSLQAAAWFGDSDNVKLLLDYGAKTNTEPIGYYGHELQAAVHTGNEATIRLLIQYGADVNAFGGHFSYPIIAAVDQGDSVATRILLEHGAHVNVRGGIDNWPVVSLAASTLRTEDLQLLIKNVSDINAACARGTTALINCADACDIDGLRFLLAHDADVHVSSEKYGTALHAAAAEGDEDCCEVLLEAGANVNAIGGPYGTALQAAAWAGDIETIDVLVKAGADITISEPISGTYGTALQAACAAGWLNVVQKLLKHNAAVNVRPANGLFGGSLSAAAAGGHTKIVKLLIRHHADVNASGGLHGFPILAAAQSGVLSVVKCLLANGANASASGGLLGSTIAAAVKGNNLDIFNKLIEHGADVHAKGGKYGDALQTAAMKADIAIIDEILGRAIELVNHKAGKYYTALIAASYFNRMEIVAKLLDAGADFRIQGGLYRSAIAAASIRGNKAILDRYLSMKPPDHLLDEALVEACAYRQSACVDALLKAGANVYARHSTRGSATKAIDAPEEEDLNSDVEEDNADEEDDDEEKEEEEETNEWEGDNVSLSGQTDEGSVTDLQLEEDVSEETKIRKLLKEAEERCKRNPTVKRFRTVKYAHMPSSLTVESYAHLSVPPLRLGTKHEVSKTSDSTSFYGVHSNHSSQEIRNQSFDTQSGDPAMATQAGYSIPNPLTGIAEVPIAFDTSIQNGFESSFPDAVDTQSPERILPRRESAPVPNSQRQDSAPTSSIPQPNMPPVRKGSSDYGLKRQTKVVNRRSIANLETLSRYHQQQRQSNYPKARPPLDSSISENDYALTHELMAEKVTGVFIPETNALGLMCLDEQGNYARHRKLASGIKHPSILTSLRRIAQVEQKIDGLVAKLVSATEDEATPRSVSSSASVPSKTRSVAQGSWMSVPSFSPIEPQLGAHIENASHDAEADRQYLEDIRGIHGFDDRQGGGQAHEGPFRPTRRREEPINEELVSSLIASGEAELLIKEFRLMSVSFPFVIIPQHLSSTELHSERPMLFLAIMMVASWKNYSQQRRLDAIYRTELAHRTIISPRKTLGLIQSLLVYLSWYHFIFSHKTQQIFLLHHLVVGLALDTGLHQDYQPADISNPRRQKPPPLSKKEMRERQRVLLGCYYVSSMIGAAFQKPNLFKYTRCIGEAAESLEQEQEHDSDKIMSRLISLRQIEEHIQDALFTADNMQLSLSDGCTLMHLRSIEAQLDAWKAKPCYSASPRLLDLSFFFSRMLLHSVALRPHASNLPPPPPSALLNSLFSSLESGKQFLDILLSFPVDEYYLISFVEWVRLPSVIITIAKLCMPNADHVACGWDAQAAQERVRLELCLESLCYRMQTLSTYDEVKQPHSDFWRAMGFMVDLTKNWYLRKIQAQARMQKNMEPRSELPAGVCPISAMSTASSTQGSEGQRSALPAVDFVCEASGGIDDDINEGNDPFALMKNADFDLEQFFDMAGGIWGDQSYNSYSDMNFGNNGSFC
ncbi:hypothetical protein yc1106_02349 [Curvularia clavata]|uniref:Uncharacterized protein n=1 Tax=Curvularia clavata TaxID=95742 RepID=A0A9Q8Z3M3_CURCL|nr:hypothetical protein yc1106_02349 [Curvularia clavata]